MLKRLLIGLVTLALSPAGLGDVNLVANPGLEVPGGAMSSVASWTVPSHFCVKGGIGRNGSRGLLMRVTKPEERQNAWTDVRLEPGRRYRFGAWVRVGALSGDTSAACLYLEWYDGEGRWIGGGQSSLAKEPGNWRCLRGETISLPANVAKGRLIAYFQQGTTAGEAVFDDFTLTPLAPEPPLGELWSSAYRNESASGPVGFYVRLNFPAAASGNALKTDFRIVDAGGRTFSPTVRRFAAGYDAVRLDVGELAVGPAEVRCTVERDGKSFSRKLVFTRLATEPIRGVRFDSRNRMLVDGRPFFPLGLWTASLTKGDVERIAASPFNVIMPYGRISRELLDLCAAKGLKVVWDMKEPYVDSQWRPADVVDEKSENAWVEREVVSVRDHPALLAWYIADEMSPGCAPQIRKRRAFVENLDPNHPSWIVLAMPEMLREYIGCFDVIGTDPYPVSDVGQMPGLNDGVRRSIDWTRQSVAAFLGRRPSWTVVQCFDWATLGRSQQAMKDYKTRPPTLAEIRSMAWQAVVGGANGIFFFNYSDLMRLDWKTPFAKTFADVCSVGHELKAFEKVLLSDEKAPQAASPTKNVAVRAWHEGGQTHWVAVNLTEQKMSVTITIGGRPQPVELAPLGVERGRLEPKMRLGVCSDIHITGRKNAGTYQKTLKWYDQQKVDAVLLCGDMADYGLVSQLKVVADIWHEVFPNNRRSDGQPVVNLFHYGDHDTGLPTAVQQRWRDKHPEDARTPSIPLADRGKVWEDCFHEPWHPIELKDVKGYKFVLYHHLSAPDSNVPRKPWMGHAEGLDTFLNAHAKELRGDKPFFYSQHRIPRGTAGGLEANADIRRNAFHEDGFSTKVLSQWPNCFTFCGDSHQTATDETMIWQDGFTAVEVPSLCYQSLKAGRENGSSGNDLEMWNPTATVPVKQMPMIPIGGSEGSYARQALLVEVYEDRIVIARRDMISDAWLGPNWVVPLPLLKERPYNHAFRRQNDPAPIFPPDAKVVVAEVRGKDRAGRPTDQYVVSFPPAVSRGGHPRAYDYEVQATAYKGSVDLIVATKRVYSLGILKPESFEDKDVTCVFAKETLTNNRDSLVFSVRPVNAFGRKGDPISCEWTK